MTNKLLRHILPCLLLLLALSGVCGAADREQAFNSRDIDSWMVISDEKIPPMWGKFSCMDIQNITSTEQNGQTYLDCQIIRIAYTTSGSFNVFPDAKWHVLLDASNSRAFILEEYVGSGPNTLALSESKDISLADNAENWTTNWDVGNAALDYLRANHPDLIPSGGAGNASVSLPNSGTSGRMLNGYPEAPRIEDLLQQK